MFSHRSDNPRTPSTLTSQKYYSVAEAAAWLQTGEDEIRALIDAGTLDARTFDGEPWITRQSLRGAMNDD